MRWTFLMAAALVAALAGTAGAQGSIKLADVAGTWTVKSHPNDTTVVTSVMVATADPKKWTLTYPDRPPLPMRIISYGGDSVVTEIGPYASLLRKGQTVTKLHSVMHVKGDAGTGWFEAHYSSGDVVKGTQESTRTSK